MKYTAKGKGTRITHCFTQPSFFSLASNKPKEAAALCTTYTWIADASKISLLLGNAYFAIPSEKNPNKPV